MCQKTSRSGSDGRNGPERHVEFDSGKDTERRNRRSAEKLDHDNCEETKKEHTYVQETGKEENAIQGDIRIEIAVVAKHLHRLCQIHTFTEQLDPLSCRRGCLFLEPLRISHMCRKEKERSHCYHRGFVFLPEEPDVKSTPCKRICDPLETRRQGAAPNRTYRSKR